MNILLYTHCHNTRPPLSLLIKQRTLDQCTHNEVCVCVSKYVYVYANKCVCANKHVRVYANQCVYVSIVCNMLNMHDVVIKHISFAYTSVAGPSIRSLLCG